VDVRLGMRATLWRGGQPDRLFAVYKDAETLAARHGFDDALETVYAFFVQYHWAKGEHDLATDYGLRCLERAAARKDLALRVNGLLYLGHTYLAQGRYPESAASYRELIDALEGPRATERFGLSGQPYSGACANAAESLIELGDVAGAAAMVARGRAVADATGHLYTQTTVAAYEAGVLVASGRPEEAITLAETNAAICRDKRFVGQLINTLRFLARAYLAVGRPADAARVMRESIAAHQAAGVSVVRGRQLVILADAQRQLGDLAGARATLEEAMGFCERQKERGTEGWVRLGMAELAAVAGDRARATAELDQAQDIAEELGMRPLVERCRAVARTLG
jgi:tetratricopeptide (TPR) repeat protein